jgi:Cd2+/Zn2+-exporting ATPase
MGRIRTVAFDKTGTLTEGRPRVTDVLVLDGTERTMLALAASVENGSSHPLGRAILDRAAADGIPLRPAKEPLTIPGRAVEAVVGGKRVSVGSTAHAAGLTTLPGDASEAVAAWEAEGKTAVIVSVDGRATGIMAVRDQPRADAATGIAALRAMGVRSLMLTGDNPRTAQAIGLVLGLDVKAGLMPEDKLREIAALKAKAPVAMVGDGINDAPALAAATVGIAMGGGTDVALETADAAVLNSRVMDIAALVGLSRATLANIHANVAIALGLKGRVPGDHGRGRHGSLARRPGGYGGDRAGHAECAQAASVEGRLFRTDGNAACTDRARIPGRRRALRPCLASGRGLPLRVEHDHGFGCGTDTEGIEHHGIRPRET